ncbi:arylamine N-acetyltransferase family protein [Serratia proteamaculans]|uniref:arylamine N-acetyltransferase family protein n=1 Tax=Serratia proteamaculans TaxID=28151 RepID=UPI00217B728A|nr:arylamine N-acetyltransferase [Serratia proteamaculans]CAI0869950.1 Arylamine N-acetyltransferase [Serratia proteamaculans]CAI0931223.1 Arylamine N-acetyltransferase [Serratia proteamaculans]
MDRQRYLQHIGFAGIPNPDLLTLQQLHRGHMLKVPFENLSIIYHQGIHLEEEALFSKIVEHNRGGFCYELNRLFALLLKDIGFNVHFISGEIRARDGSFGAPFDHMALMVELNQPYLVDVGFGDSFLTPLKITTTEQQPQTSGTFHLEQEGETYYLERRNGDNRSHAKTLYRFTLQAREPSEFDGMCHYHSTSPQSHFTQRLVCSRPTENGRVTLSENKLIITEDHQRHESTLHSEQERREALMRYFSIDLES